MRMEIYKPEEIELVLAILEDVQDLLDVEDHDTLYRMIDEALDILVPLEE